MCLEHNVFVALAKDGERDKNLQPFPSLRLAGAWRPFAPADPRNIAVAVGFEPKGALAAARNRCFGTRKDRWPMTRGTNPGRNTPDEIQKDNARGRAWGGLTAVLLLLALFLMKKFGGTWASWPLMIAGVVLISGGLAALIFRKSENKGSGPNNNGADGPGEK